MNSSQITIAPIEVSGQVYDCELFVWPDFEMTCCGYREDLHIHIPLARGEEEDRAEEVEKAFGDIAHRPYLFAPTHPCANSTPRVPG